MSSKNCLNEVDPHQKDNRNLLHIFLNLITNSRKNALKTMDGKNSLVLSNLFGEKSKRIRHTIQKALSMR